MSKKFDGYHKYETDNNRVYWWNDDIDGQRGNKSEREDTHSNECPCYKFKKIENKTKNCKKKKGD